MSEEEVQVNENTEPAEPTDASDSDPVAASEEVTYTVVVSNLDEITPYHDLEIAIDCMMMGLLLVLIIAIVWVKHL